MKKIIYSVVCAFIINVVLALIFPTWFLNGDACRTYLSDAARVDIALIGNVKNGRVTAEGADVRISQPAWFSDKTYQGTVVEVPVSYRSKSRPRQICWYGTGAVQSVGCSILALCPPVPLVAEHSA